MTEQLDQTTQETVSDMIDHAPPASSPPPEQQPQPDFLGALSSTNYMLGSIIDMASYKILCQRALEYEVTIKQLALCAAAGNKPSFERLLAQLQGAIHMNEVTTVTMLRAIMENKIAQVPKPGRQDQPDNGVVQDECVNDVNTPTMENS